MTSAAEAPEPLRQWAGHAVCSEVLEHLDDPAGVLANARAFIKPGGRLVITVPGGPMSAFDRHIGHRRHYTKALLGQVLLAAGFETAKVAAAGWPMFNLYRLAVLLRGGRLIEDAAGAPGPLARTAMGLFRHLMRLTLADTPWGWQIVAVARKKN
ncbi:MAG TPA: methyltransferase domain-containing protein [Rhodospirillaceae bacterium]|jgi:SAM-dependent methyltransferase|nr:methyltransferase domain-containing protein [Rhodospirillaceae bacterium]HIJ92877.1 methyltransferase domain-containing protein [Rhodospirillaceae bacterium]